MIQKIKSVFIMKKVTYLLEEKRKLLLFNYNKSIQIKLNIGITDYMLHSQIYKIGGKNGKGKEYEVFNKKLIFEGEYKNGKKNGMGTYYYTNLQKVVFKGNYKDGIRNRKGIDYYFSGNIKFEGEYLNGYQYNGKGYDFYSNFAYEIKNGIGYVKEYDILGILLFEGEYKNCVRNGKGKEYNRNGKLLFEGEFKNGKKWNGIFFVKKK